MDYEKKYKEIVGKIRKAYLYAQTDSTKAVLEDVFPELAESEGEKVRKELTKHLKELSDWKEDEVIPIKNPSYYRQWASWLEKQGQVKESTISQHENKMCKENDDSLTSEDERIRKEIINYFQCQSEEEPTRKESHNKWIAWLENIPVTIDHEKREGFHLGYKAGLERLEMKSAEESLGIDSDTYNKIVDECIFGEQKPEENKGNIGGISPNSEWSVEDMSNVQRICKYLNEAKKYYADITEVRECIDWLHSLQDRVQPKQKWSEEDEKIINGLIDSLTRISLNTRTDSTSPNFSFYKEIDWLKSLRPQNKWKPSNEQIAQLQIVVDTYDSEGIYDPILTDLLFQLKKLKEE